MAASAVNASQAAASPAGLCVLTAEQTVGPYYLANQKIRKDVTEGKAGVPLRLRMTVLDSTKCAALPKAAVDIWHADAGGNYSGFSGGGRPGGNQANGQTFLRGTQITDSSGLVEFDTIYPGWYPGRAIHIHLRVHVGGAAGTTYNGGHVSHTGQLFFPENISDQVVKLAPYSSHGGVRTLQNQDSIFRSQHGGASIPKMTPINSAYVAEMTLAVDPNAARSETQ